MVALDPDLAAIWKLAAPLLRLRDDDAQALLDWSCLGLAVDSHREADAGIFIPTVMLHDVGWSQVPAARGPAGPCAGAGGAGLRAWKRRRPSVSSDEASSRRAGELSNYLDMTDDLLAEPLKINDGAIRVRDVPGVGAEIDPDKLTKYRQD